MSAVADLLREARINVDAAIAKYSSGGPSEAVFENVANAVSPLLHVERLLREPLGKAPAGAINAEPIGRDA